jgi:hypothetical protein
MFDAMTLTTVVLVVAEPLPSPIPPKRTLNLGMRVLTFVHGTLSCQISTYDQGVDLNDPSRNEAVAEGMAQRVLKYGGSKEAGRVMGGEGCQIYVSLEFEVSQIQGTCDAEFRENIERDCS